MTDGRHTAGTAAGPLAGMSVPASTFIAARKISVRTLERLGVELGTESYRD